MGTASLLGQSTEGTETLDARKGLIHLLAGDPFEAGDYHVRTSFQYFLDEDLLDGGNEVEATSAKLGFGYSLFEYIRLSASGGVDVALLDIGAQSQSISLIRFDLAATAADDLGQRFGLKSKRLMGAASLQLDLTKPTRFFDGIGGTFTLALTSDWTDQQIPVRVHGNLGVRPKSGSRYFDRNALDVTNNLAVDDFDYFAVKAIENIGIRAGLGFEFPLEYVTPSLEYNIEYLNDAGFSESPQQVTVGLKGHPFPQKNIDLFAAVDIGLSSYTNAAVNARPEAYAVPLWNAILGFGITQFGKRAGEIGIDARQYQKTVDELRAQNELLAALKKDLAYNSLTGRVIDSETKRPISGVSISFPESPELSASSTDKEGQFRRFFPHLKGTRVLFSRDGYQPSSKFYALKPGESVQADIELQKGDATQLATLVMNITDEDGLAVAGARVIARQSGQDPAEVQADSSGRLRLNLNPGSYVVEIRAPGYQLTRERIQLEPGKALLRTLSLKKL